MIEKRFGGNENGASIGDGGMRRKKKGNPKSVGGKLWSLLNHSLLNYMHSA
jgi:hypothetical protein